MERRRLEKIKDSIEKLDEYEHKELYKIIKEFSTNITKTNTGALVSAEELPAECIESLEKKIKFFIDQRKTLEKR
jgi:hypothetical protein